jgi:hypothetical protein
MKREGWEQHLHDYIESSRSLAFAWGENDCCLWVAKFIDLVTGRDIAGQYEVKYNTAEGAQVFLESLGYENTAAMASAHLPEIPLTRAGRGDIVMIEGGALGICDGRRSFFFVENVGLMALLTLKCQKAWEV